VQAAMVMAKRFPRNPLQARDRILNSFTRPKLAETSQYQYSKGGTDVAGPSIRAMEAIAQQWGNIEWGFEEVTRNVGADGVTFSEVRAYAYDLEAITYRPLTFIVRHWRDTRKGGYQLTDEREIYELIANMAQRRVRACLTSIIPSDIVDDAMAQADLTLKTKADTSPDGIKNLLSAFEPFGVTKEQIEKRIQRRMDAITPAQVVNLKRIYVSMRDGISEASEWFDPIEASQTATSDLPSFSDEKFATELKKWEPLVKTGKRTADQIIAMASSKNTLSEQQIAAIQALAANAPEQSISEDQCDELMTLADELAISSSDICKRFGIKDVAALPASKFEEAKAFINNPISE